MTPIFTFLLLLICTTAAHLPAVRRSVHQDEKRVLASRLIRSADRHKERSLRDVLVESDAPISKNKNTSDRDEERRKMRAEELVREHVSKDDDTTVRPEGHNKHSKPEFEDEQEDEQDGGINIRTMSQLFAWAINNTVTSASFSYSTKLPHSAAKGKKGDNASAQDMRAGEKLSGDMHMESPSRQKALPAGEARPRNGRNTRQKRKVRDLGLSKEDFDLLNSVTENEFDVMRRNVRVLAGDKEDPKQTVSALLMLEELCHSIDNGRDLQISGGIKPLLAKLESRYESVRASAAWALATCCQNNPPVQNASLGLDAVPMLSQLAARDESATVRAKALFALNAMLELESARIRFEELPDAIEVLRNALVDSSNYRATRRALNLAELLVQKNLDAWKTQLEAYDIPAIIELLMRSHPDIDVRESAARTIAALDGRHVA